MHDEDQSNNISLDADGQPVKEEKLDATPEDDSAPNDINTKSSEEKKHRRELSSQDLCEASSQVEKSQSHKKREAENIVQDVSDFTATSTPEKNHMVEISMTARHENLIQKHGMRKMKKFQANQKEILCWCSYIVEFDKKTAEFTTEYKVGEKKAKELFDSQIQTIIDYFSKNPNIELPDDQDDSIIDFEDFG
ncbi:hypothetical protein RhiirA5_475333 [Rhizophagus irregularis]|uniref:Uncharacterized protein n=1 Tax=Rhizophagus irregularis TaxID=588596 RepID=A0A2N0PQE8_9GLOM|nr:hypothetical protein RhiirA5_475333 [Rhizophagus irregularis]